MLVRGIKSKRGGQDGGKGKKIDRPRRWLRIRGSKEKKRPRLLLRIFTSSDGATAG